MRACGPWVQALLRRMLPLSAGETLPQGLRFGGIDASSMQAPGAKGTDHRLPLALAFVAWQCLEVWVSDVHTGEPRNHCTVAPGDGVLADRGSAQCQGLHGAIKQGAALIVRLHPCRVGLRDAVGAPWALSAVWKRPKPETLRTLGVALHAAGGQHEGRGWGHASRLHVEPANRARHTCRQGHKKGPPSAERLFWAGWVLLFTTLAPAVLSAQTIMALYRCRGHGERAIKRWKRVLDIDALRAKANSPLAEVWLHGQWL